MVDDTSGITSEQELVVLGELDACDSRLVILYHMDGTLFMSLVQLKNADFVVEVAAHV